MEGLEGLLHTANGCCQHSRARSLHIGLMQHGQATNGMIYSSVSASKYVAAICVYAFQATIGPPCSRRNADGAALGAALSSRWGWGEPGVEPLQVPGDIGSYCTLLLRLHDQPMPHKADCRTT
jgi:hypothetical protein